MIAYIPENLAIFDALEHDGIHVLRRAVQQLDKLLLIHIDWLQKMFSILKPSGNAECISDGRELVTENNAMCTRGRGHG